MKKTPKLNATESLKLSLRTLTLRRLEPNDLEHVVGGGGPTGVVVTCRCNVKQC